MTVVGVDAYKGGWVAVAVTDGEFTDARTFTSFQAVRSHFDAAEAIGVDIPIGLPSMRPMRAADAAARRFLSPRVSVVFPTYPEEVYRLREQYSKPREAYGAARQLCAARGWPVISAQSFALAKGIIELIPFTEDPGVFEVHPEVSFKELAGRDLIDKKTWNGFSDRLALLGDANIQIDSDLPRAAAAPVVDVLDAAVGAWSACRYATSRADPLPADHVGRTGAIWR